MERRQRLLIEKNLFIFASFVAALGMIKWTSGVFNKFLSLSYLGFDVATVVGAVLIYLTIRYISHDI